MTVDCKTLSTGDLGGAKEQTLFIKSEDKACVFLPFLCYSSQLFRSRSARADFSREIVSSILLFLATIDVKLKPELCQCRRFTALQCLSLYI